MKILKLQQTATNQHVNIPKAWLEILGAKKGDDVQAEFDFMNNRIILDFNKNKESKEEKKSKRR